MTHLILIILLIPKSNAELETFYNEKWQENWPENCSSAYVKINISAGISIIKNRGSSIDYVIANLSFFPKSTEFQKSVITTSPYAESSKGHMFFKWERPQEEKLFYEVNADIFSEKALTKIGKYIKFPITEVPEEEKKYLKATQHINFDSEISKIASEIVKGSGNLFEAVSRIGFWVNKNVEYDLDYADEVMDARWVLQNKRGTCDELSSLFIALCRSIGIPARYAAGVAYSNIPELLGFGNHGWAEVYFPGYGWVAFDVTYGQFGFVDASHIKFLDSEDTEIFPVRYRWSGHDVEVNATMLEIKTELQSIIPDAELIRINSGVFEKYIDTESFDLIIADISNPNDFHIAAAVRISDNEGLRLFSEKTQYIYLKPLEKGKLFWIVKTDGLDRNYIYTIPVTVYSGISSSTVKIIVVSRSTRLDYDYLLREIEKETEMTKEERSDLSRLIFNCSRNGFYVNESGLSNCSLVNVGNTLLKNLKACFGSDCRNTELAIMEKRVFEVSFNTSSVGTKRARMSVSNEDVSTISGFEYRVIERPAIDISQITYPEIVNGEKNFNINLTIKKICGKIKGLNIALKPENLASNASVSGLEGELPVNININSKNLRPGKNQLTIEIEFYDEFGEKYAKIEQIEIYVKKNLLLTIEFILYRIGEFFEQMIQQKSR